MGIGRVEVGSLAKITGRRRIGTLVEPGNSKAQQQADRVGEQAVAFAEDLDGGLSGTVEKKFGAPIEEIGLAGVEPGGALVLAGRLERVAAFFLDVAE